MLRLKVAVAALLLAIATQLPTLAQEGGQAAQTEAPPEVATAKDPPYEARLSRLAEVLGSVHYLRSLCGDKSMAWRGSMEELLAAENPSPERKAEFVARFNHGYRAFHSVHQQCNQSAGTALARYMQEGEKLAEEIASRYSD
jgi:uncharacterized protein (TIGR02301 family)